MDNPPITLGNLAKKFNLNRETIRYYERSGLIQAAKRSGSGYRIYDDTSIKTISFILKSKSMGFTLGEIHSLLSLRVTSATRCKEVRAEAEKKIIEIDQKMKDLKSLKKALQGLVGSCLAGATSSVCPIIDNLED